MEFLVKEYSQWNEDKRIILERCIYLLEDEIFKYGYDHFVDTVIKHKNFKYNFFVKRVVIGKEQYRLLCQYNGKGGIIVHQVYLKNKATGQCSNDFNGKYIDIFKKYIKKWEAENKEVIEYELKTSI